MLYYVGDTKPLFSSKDTNESSAENPAFLKKLKKLNESVIKFATEHIKKNPYVILTNVFNDYDRHLKRIQEKCIAGDTSEDNKHDSTEVDNKITPANTSSSEDGGSLAESKKTEVNEDPVKPEFKPIFSFSGNDNKETEKNNAPVFSFKPTPLVDTDKPSGTLRDYNSTLNNQRSF